MHRSKLIKDYDDKLISKKEFLIKSYEFFSFRNPKPFLFVNTYEKGMYNYQYYNIVAKYYRMLAKEEKNKRTYNRFMNISNKNYDLKDRMILEILKLKNFKNISAYYINCDSKGLEGKIFEIVLKDEKEAIFHTKNEKILEVLKEKNIFEKNKKNSLIDKYINERYWA